MQFYGPYYMELRIDDLMAHCDFKIYVTGSSGSKGARFPLDLCLEANWLCCLRRHEIWLKFFSFNRHAVKNTDFISKPNLSGFGVVMGLPLFSWLARKSCSRGDAKQSLIGLYFPKSVVEFGQQSQMLQWREWTDERAHTHILAEKTLQ